MTMECPICGAKTIVVDSRFVRDGGYTRRRRHCIPKKGKKRHAFSTIEEPVRAGSLKSSGGIMNKPSEMGKAAVMDRLKQILELE